MLQDNRVQVWAEPLRAFCIRVFECLGVPTADAYIVADNLVTANLRGVDSHGVARLRRYVNGIRDGMMVPHPRVRTVVETPATATLDAGGGLGQPVSYRAFVTVRNSNHYGIAAYYAMMALEHDCVGISMTNAAVLVVPTFGRDAVLGTNPIAVAAPAGEERPFVLDMATSAVPRGKLEVYHREGRALPLGWATDEAGEPTTDAAQVLDNLLARRGGGLLPIGGAGELLGGHKGYGLGLLVDVLSAVLSGAAYANLVYPKTPDGQPLPSNIGHFFGAWRIDAFRPLEEFRAAMDDLQRRLKSAPKAEGQDRIYIHGEKEYEEAERRSREGIPLNPKVVADLEEIGRELGVESAI
jgi:L-2-hydroxycarboxylate dehydrogenase (NAD+)